MARFFTSQSVSRLTQTMSTGFLLLAPHARVMLCGVPVLDLLLLPTARKRQRARSHWLGDQPGWAKGDGKSWLFGWEEER